MQTFWDNSVQAPSMYRDSSDSTLSEFSFDHFDLDIDWGFSSPSPKVSRQRARLNSMDLPDHPAQYYSTYVTGALNAYDKKELFSTLLERCNPDVKIVKYTYSLTSHDAQEKGVSSYQFRDIDEFCNYMEAWNMLVPDGVFETTNARVCVNCAPTFVFMSQLRFSGQKLGKRINLLEDSLQHYGCTYHPYGIMMDGQEAVDFETRGSLSIFVNTKGLIERLELYFCLPSI